MESTTRLIAKVPEEFIRDNIRWLKIVSYPNEAGYYLLLCEDRDSSKWDHFNMDLEELLHDCEQSRGVGKADWEEFKDS